MTWALEDADAWWHAAFGASAPYGDLTTADVLSNLAFRGPDFAKAVLAFERAMPCPNVDVLHAAEDKAARAK